MDFTKNKSPYPVQLVVRASAKVNSRNYTKRSYKPKFRSNSFSSVQISEYYSKDLKRFQRGKTQALALCPFHDDHNPSFTVNLETGAFLCFACGKSGRNLIGYHAKRYGLSYVEAIKALEVWNE